MASLQKRNTKKGQTWLIQFSVSKGRRTLFLGSKYSQRDAKEIALVVERVAASLETGFPLDARTRQWVESLTGDLLERFKRAGLVERKKELTIKELYDEYFKAKTSLASESFRCKTDGIKRIARYIPDNAIADSITPSDVSTINDELRKSSLAEATIRGTFRSVSTIFNWGIKAGLIESNPFNTVPRSSTANSEREHYVPIQDYREILSCCKTRQERVLLTLYRIGGLRAEEATLIRWSDVDFNLRRFIVHSPKTAHSNKASRIVPLFPSLYNELTQLRLETNSVDDDYIIDFKQPYIVIRRLILNSKVPRFTKLLQNLRLSASNDIYRIFGEICEQEWLGHTVKIAQKHYLRLTDEDFAKATGQKSVAKSVEEIEEFIGKKKEKQE